MKKNSDTSTHPTAVLRKLIKNFSRINFERVDIDILYLQLRHLMRGFVAPSPVWDAGKFLYRGNFFEAESDKPMTVGRIASPPKHLSKLGRANRPSQPKFYCSSHPDPLAFELGLRPGDFLTIATWRVIPKLSVISVGFTPSTFESLDSLRFHEPWMGYDELKKNQRVLTDFFSESFVKKVMVGQHHLYKLSAAMAEALLTGHGEAAVAGLHYPSVAMFANQDNFALDPKFVELHMEIYRVDFYEILNGGSNKTFMTRPIDHADSFTALGAIEWKGGPDPSLCGTSSVAGEAMALASGLKWDSESKMAYFIEGEAKVPVGFAWLQPTIIR